MQIDHICISLGSEFVEQKVNELVIFFSEHGTLDVKTGAGYNGADWYLFEHCKGN